MTIAFAELSRRAQLHRLRDAAVRALQLYGIDDAELRMINHDFNTTYRVTTAAGRFALRINVNSRHDAAAIEAEATWVEAIARDTGLVVPAPVRTSDGRSATAIDVDGLDRAPGVVLYSWLDGPNLGDSPSKPRLASLGAAMATLHEHTTSWTHPSLSARPVMTSALMDSPDNLTSDERWLTGGDRVSILAALAHVQGVLSPVFEADPILIHGDLHGWNTKWIDHAVALFDFDDCGLGTALQDLSISAYYLRDQPGAEAALLDGYASVRSVPDHEPAQFEALLVARNLLLLNDVLASVTADVADFLPGYIGKTARRVQGYLDTGRFDF